MHAYLNPGNETLMGASGFRYDDQVLLTTSKPTLP
jgi:hypothetical protein